MIKNVLKGILAYRNTFQLMGALNLWKYFAVPMVISVLTALGIGILAWGLSDTIGSWIAVLWKWEWGSATFQTVSEVLGAILIIAIGIVIYKHVVMALSAPFMSPVSEKIEHHLYGTSKTATSTSGFSAQLWRGIKINTRNLGMELILTIPILLLSLIPIVNFFTGFALFLVQSYYAGFGNMDYTLERHMDARNSIQFVRGHSGIAVGNGIVFMLLLLVPVVGIIFVFPLSVTAATTETLRIVKPNAPLKASI